MMIHQMLGATPKMLLPARIVIGKQYYQQESAHLSRVLKNAHTTQFPIQDTHCQVHSVNCAAILVHTRNALSSTIINSHQETVSGQACNPPDPFFIFH